MQIALAVTMTLKEPLGKFLPHKRHNSYTVDEEMLWVGSPITYVAHYEYRGSCFYICTYAMCSSFLKAVTQTLSISVEAA